MRNPQSMHNTSFSFSRAEDSFSEIEAESRRILGEAEGPVANPHQVIPAGEFNIELEMERIRARP